MSGNWRTLLVCSAALALLYSGPLSGQHRGSRAVSPASLRDLREWDAQTESMLRGRELRIRESHPDPLVARRTIQRADQYYHGVRVFGGDIARQLENGVVISVFGTIYTGISIDAVPVIDAERAREIAQRTSGTVLADSHRPELVLLPRDNTYVLTWRLIVAGEGDIRQYFVDAHSGSIALDYSLRKTQTAAVGRALGVLGDTKKISVSDTGSRFIAQDLLRPPAIRTLDMHGSLGRTTSILNGFAVLGSDVASDDDNNWTDGAVDDAHVYQGWTYDYYFKRFGRRGLDNHDLAITGLANPVRRTDLATSSDAVIGTYFLNAFYAGGGHIVYGVGLPDGFFTESPLGRQTWDFLSGALDVVGHELTHGVTEYTSNLIYQNESGALDEAFSDMMGTSIEFFFQPPGTGLMEADYSIAEDVVRPGGIRSLANPRAYGDPDHYTRRFTGTSDNGGVHTNSTIVSHAFYLAIEGGTNSTSGLSVQGVGAANREQIEKIFYRAFTELLPASSTFAIARAATIQAARDLYGETSNAARAITQAWDAVGVN